MGERRALQSVMKLKVHELRNKSKGDLEKQLEELKNELAQLRVSKVTGGAASKLAKIKVVRKSIARVLTVYNQNQKARLRKHTWGKHVPLDLRAKKTRVIRRALSAEDAARKTLRQRKKGIYFPQRKFALRR